MITLQSCLKTAATILCVLYTLSVSHAQTPAPLHIAIPTNSGTWFPLHVALKKNIFREFGINVVPVYMQARTSLAAIASNQIGYITQIGSPMTAMVKGLPLRVIMVFCERSHHVLIVKPGITSMAQLRAGVVAISQPGGTVHRELQLILEQSGVEPNEVNVRGLGSTPSGVAALRNGTVDAAMLSIPYDLYLEKEGFKPLVYVKDILEFPLAGIVVHNDRLRDRPDEITKVLTGVLKGIRYTKTHREEMPPLLKDFLGLESLDMAKKAYDRLRDIWPNSGVASDKGLRTAANVAQVPPNFPLEKLADWSFVKKAAASIKDN
jgi:ABC-type nitrate/sulfonate/bicarbonate transport system substrate-binding protein